MVHPCIVLILSKKLVRDQCIVQCLSSKELGRRFDLETDYEILWLQISTQGHDSFLLGVYYRPPGNSVEDSVQLNNSLVICLISTLDCMVLLFLRWTAWYCSNCFH